MLWRKRTVKAQVWRRRVERHMPEAPVSVASIPIEVRDQREFVHYPASTADMRAVLELLPPGTLDGVSRVVLCLGAEYQRELVETGKEFGDPDPLLGRLSIDSLPEVYVGSILGNYFADDASIWVYAYIYDAATMPDRELRELYLRLSMLATLVHEVAHHWDGTTCNARGRWADRPYGKSERSARKRAYWWVRQLVIPYLERRYPAASRALVEWVGKHGGVALPLSKLVNHPDESIFYTGGAVEALFSACDRGVSPLEARLEFARDLHLAERFDEALETIAAILGEHPGDCEVRTLQADIYEHQERHELAEEVARAIIADDPACAEAWEVLVHVYRAQGRWRELETAATQTMALSAPDGRTAASAQCARACARAESGDLAGAAADLEELQRNLVRTTPGIVDSLRALLLLRTGRYEEALRMAHSRLQRRRRMPTWGMLLAVRYEAAHRLGRPQEAGTISARAATLLRQFGHGQWLDRLVADYGLRIWSKHRTS